jgi:hypothetical protein
MRDIKVVVILLVKTIGFLQFSPMMILLGRGAFVDVWRHAYPSERAELSDPAVSK